MRFGAIWPLILIAFACSIAAANADEKINATIYLALERDVCPGGYVRDKCPTFTGSHFDDLRRQHRLRRIGRVESVPVRIDANGMLRADVELSDEAKSLARRYTALRNSAALPFVALVVVERANLDDVTGSIGKSSNNRRSFDHARLSSLNPED